VSIGEEPIRDDVPWIDLLARRMTVAGSDAIERIMALSTAGDVITFSGGFPDPATFPAQPLPQLLAELVADADDTAFQYAPTTGLPSMLDYLAGRLEERDGRRPADGELMVTSGSIDALGLVSKAFLDTGDAAVVEAPTYLGAIMAFRGFDARVATVPVDDDGMVVEELGSALRDGLRPKLVYTIPDHQNPAGVTMSEERRVELVELARRYGFLVVEDVAYRELGFDGARLPALWTLGPDVVMQAGTFSKTFCPGVRLGWAAAPRPVTRALVIGKQNSDQCAAALGQRLVEKYGRSGLLDEGIARSRQLYGHRCTLLLDALERHMPEGARWTRPGGGFFSWLTLPPGFDTVEVAAAALEQKVAYVPGVPFFPDGRGTDTARLSFSRVSDDDIDEGIRLLAGLLHR
jgi:2-aminoadipate transaminase